MTGLRDSGRANWAFVLAATVALVLAVPALSQTQQPQQSAWVGQVVVPKSPNFTLTNAEKSSVAKGPPAIYHVSLASGNALLMSTAGLVGWALVDQVVPLEQARSFFTGQIRAHPGVSFNYMMRALVGLATGDDPDTSLVDLNEALRLAPREIDNYLARAEVWRAKGDFQSAVADCDAAIRLNPKSAAALVLRASIWADHKQYDKAIADYSEVIRHDPQVFPAYFGRAAVQGEKGEIDKAIADLSTAIGLDPRLPHTYLARAAAWKHKGENDKAVADLSEAIKLDRRNAHAYHSRGVIFSAQKQYEKAINDYSEAIRLDPTKAVGYCDRGFAWKAQKEFDNAIADYTEAIRLDPRDSDAYCGRGWAWHEKKDYARALSDFSQALRIDPRDACALDGRAWIWSTCPDATERDGKKAVEVAIEACELTRWKEAYCLETLAAAHAETGDFASAVKWQTKAIELEADPKEKDEYRARLKLFQDKKPFRETRP
jgi:tetratricopeptide (TPR) repeat protein